MMTTGGDGTLRLLLQFLRAEHPGEPYAFRFEPQDYILPTGGGDSPSARFDWSSSMLADLQAIRLPGRDPAVVQRVGERLRSFVKDAGWAPLELQIAEAIAARRRISLTLRSSAAELYALPWELLTLRSGQFLGELDGLLIRYEWPESQTAQEQQRPRPEGGRVLVAWSAAAGAVPAAEHIRAISTACAAGFHPFNTDSDVIPEASLERIVQTLEQAQQAGPPIAILHLLCHGGATGSTFGLSLDGASGPVVVDAGQLRQQLAPFASMVRLVVVSACDTGNLGALGNRLGSVAQALHRCGFEAVIASRFPLSAAGSISLTESFYAKLLQEPASIETAFLAARKRLARTETGLPLEQRPLDWASLQLYSRHADGEDSRPVVFRPYRGLLAFQPEHRRFFFGRDAEVQEILADIQALLDKKKERFLVVAGASGTGKSSLVFAGAVPKLLERNPQLVFLRMRPGSDPEQALTEALGKRPAAAPALLVVDQFEEVFTQTERPAAREAFVRRLWSLAAAPDEGLQVLITLRVDFIGRCGELVVNDAGLRLDRVAYDEDYRVFVAQLPPEQLRAAMVEPAHRVGLDLQSGLADRMLEDVGSEPGALPLLEDVLDELWQHRAEKTLTQKAYDELGGVIGALRSRADAIVDKLTQEDLAIAKRLLVSLVAVTDGTALDTRLRVPLADLRDSFAATDAAGFERVLKEMVAARLLVQDGDERASRVEVAHEALIRKWPKLSVWLDEDRAGLLMQRRVKQAAQQWESQGRDESLLYRGGQLAQASFWRQTWESRLGELEQRFLNASEALRARMVEQAEAQLRQERERREQVARLQLEKQQQRTRLLRIGILISSSLTLAACVLGLLAVKQTRLARQQTHLASQRLGESVEVAKQIVIVGEQRLSQVAGAAEARQDLLALSNQLLKTLNATGDAGADDVQVWRLFHQGDLIQHNPHLGDQQIREAMRLYEQALAIAEAQLKQHPGNRLWRSNRADALSKLGTVLEIAGKRSEAARRYEESLVMFRMLAEADPSETGWLLRMAESFANLGGTNEATGKLPEAARCYTESLAIARQLAAAEPKNPHRKYALAVSLSRLGSVLAAMGKLPQATLHHEESLAIFRQLEQTGSCKADCQRNLELAHESVGEVLQAAGKLPQAGQHYEAALSIIRKLAETDPGNTKWQHGLAVSSGKLGEVLEAEGKVPQATLRYEETLAIIRKLADADPGNSDWQVDLSTSLGRLGWMREKADKLPAATQLYQESLTIMRKLTAADPGNTSWQRELAGSLEKLAGWLEPADRQPEVTRRNEEALTIRKKLAEADPSNAGWQHDLALSFARLGAGLQRAGRLSEAAQRYEDYIAIMKKLTAADPSNTGWQRDLEIGLYMLGALMEKTGQLDQAGQRYAQALALLEKRSARNPDDVTVQRELLISHLRFVSLLSLPAARDRGREELVRHHAAARAILERFKKERLFARDPVLLAGHKTLAATAKLTR